MAAPKIFVTGATGYIGGDALYAIVEAHPEYEITCLVRNSDRGTAVASQYAKVKLVYGSLDDADLVQVESKKADIVLHAADADHEGAAKAIATGIAERPSSTPGFWIHTSGSAIITYADTERQVYGEASTKVYDDWDGISEVISLPDFAPHRKIDKIVLAASAGREQRVKTAIVCPPTIYGPGRGPGNQRSIQTPILAERTFAKGAGLQIGEGKALWANVHVWDLSKVYLTLVEEAVKGGGKATWNEDGYYFTENGEHAWGQIAEAIASVAHKQNLIPSAKVVSLSPEEGNNLETGGAIIWGTNSRCKAIRARKLLGWTPTEQTLEADVPRLIESEAKRAGLVQGHGQKVSG